MKKLLAIGLIAVALTAACGSSSGSSSSTTTTTSLGPPNKGDIYSACTYALHASTLDASHLASATVIMAHSNVAELVDASNEILKAPTLTAQIAILDGKPLKWCLEHHEPTLSS